MREDAEALNQVRERLASLLDAAPGGHQLAPHLRDGIDIGSELAARCSHWTAETKVNWGLLCSPIWGICPDLFGLLQTFVALDLSNAALGMLLAANDEVQAAMRQWRDSIKLYADLASRLEAMADPPAPADASTSTSQIDFSSSKQQPKVAGAVTPAVSESIALIDLHSWDEVTMPSTASFQAMKGQPPPAMGRTEPAGRGPLDTVDFVDPQARSEFQRALASLAEEDSRPMSSSTLRQPLAPLARPSGWQPALPLANTLNSSERLAFPVNFEAAVPIRFSSAAFTSCAPQDSSLASFGSPPIAGRQVRSIWASVP